MTPSSGSALRRLDIASVQAALRHLARANKAPWLHAEVARRMAQRLSVIRLKPQAILEWWAFGGAAGDLLAKAYPDAQRFIVEPSGALGARSRLATRAPWWSTRRWAGKTPIIMSPEEVAANSVQLVWANMMLHAEVDPLALMTRWHRALMVDGFAMFSCLGPDTLRELRDLYKRLGWPSAMADQVDMHDLGDMLLQAGFVDPVMDQETLMFSWASPQALLAELRTLGRNASPDRFAGLRTPRWCARLMQEINAMAGPDGRISLRFEVAYGHAFKAVPRLPMSAQTRVSLDDMRAMVRTHPTRA